MTWAVQPEMRLATNSGINVGLDLTVPMKDSGIEWLGKLKINQLETITDDVVEAAASILVIGNQRHGTIKKGRHKAIKSTHRRAKALQRKGPSARTISFRTSKRQ